MKKLIEKSGKIFDRLLIIVFLLFRKNETLTQCKSNIHHIIKSNRFSSENIEKLQEYLHKIARQQV
jgi:hypothetical protein